MKKKMRHTKIKTSRKIGERNKYAGRGLKSLQIKA
jgi:hypothetical protein